MKNKRYLFTLSALLIGLLIFSNDSQAQRGRYYRGYPRGYAYRSVRPAYHYYPRSYVRVGVGYRAPVRYYSRPYVGVRINVLPVGYYRFFMGNYPYYYYNGIYYRSYNNYYQTVAPPMGAIVPRIPPGSKATVIDGQKYYEFNGTYYRETVDEKNKAAYEVVGTDGVLNTQQEPVYEDQVGDIVDQLPENCTTVQLNGETYYQSPAGKYYQEKKDGDNTYYEVVGQTDEPPAENN